jgi:hypothetical protein
MSQSKPSLEKFFASESMYLAVSSHGFNESHAQQFSPKVMLWKSLTAAPTLADSAACEECRRDIWIFDVSRCAAYWRLQADQLGLTIYELFLKILAETCGGSAQFSAVLADHPWRAVLALNHMRERNLNGLVNTNQGMGALLLQQVSWKTWWKCVSELEALWALNRDKRYRPAAFRRQVLQLRRASERLNIKQPANLRAVSLGGIQRRFGGLLKDIWQCSFQYDSASDVERSSATSQLEVPWVDFRIQIHPHVKRHLDFGMQAWETIEPALREDLDRLCRSTDWTSLEKVVSLEWRLTFDDMSSRPIAIQFRHPHCLHREMGHHRTTLLQAYYSFSAAHGREEMSSHDTSRYLQVPQSTDSIVETFSKERIRASHRTREDASDFPRAMVGQLSANDPQTNQTSYHTFNERPPQIVAWELKVLERLIIPAFMADLFDRTAASTSLVELENRLGVPLHAYHLKTDWQPEDAYVLLRSTAHDTASQDYLHASLIAAAQHRPLFIFSKPVPYNQKGQSSGWQFLERTMAKWWEPRPIGDPVPSIQRDYYRMIDPDQRNFWVYKNSLGQWYMHGIFA